MKKLLFIMIASTLFACNGTTTITQTSVSPETPKTSYSTTDGIIVNWSATLHPTDSTNKTFVLHIGKFSAEVKTIDNGIVATVVDTIPVVVK